MKKKISPEIKSKCISLSGKLFWFWKSFYNFYASILNIPARELEYKIPRENFNKYDATEKILNDLENGNRKLLLEEIIKNIYSLKTPFDKSENPNYEEAVVLLKDFKEIVGPFLEDENEEKEINKKIKNRIKKSELEKEKSKKLNNIKEEFFELAMNDNRQKAGYWLEKAFFNILSLENIESSNPYKTVTEQIDGHFKFDKWDYLVEIKWTSKKVKQKDIAIFNGKIETKAQSTRGFMLSMSGFDESAENKAENSGSPKIIFMGSEEWINILEERVFLKDVLKTKVDVLVRHGKVYNK